jgi:hypothetical protein
MKFQIEVEQEVVFPLRTSASPHLCVERPLADKLWRWRGSAGCRAAHRPITSKKRQMSSFFSLPMLNATASSNDVEIGTSHRSLSPSGI